MNRILSTLILSAGAGAFAASAQTAPQPLLGPAHADKIGNSKWDNADGHDIREVATDGEMRVLVLLAEFQDQKFTSSSDPRQLISDMLNSPGFDFAGATGSVRDYFDAVSSGQFKPVFDVYGPATMSHNHSFYAGTGWQTVVNDEGVEEKVLTAGLMIESACKQLDGEIDFSKYDANGDGYVDFVYVFHAGQGATTGGSTTATVWPHASQLSDVIFRTPEFDGVKVNRYVTSSELYSDGRLGGIGMFVHEFSHVLGLPDLYDTANNTGTATSVFHPNYYDTMAAGNYLNSMKTPVLYSSYEQYALEWLLPTTLTGSGRFTLLPLCDRSFAYKIPSKSNPQDYFLLECRAPAGWDSYIPGSGMLVWHIDFDLALWQANKPNNSATHQHIDLVEADDDLTETSRTGDPFPGASGICEFNSSMSPALTGWDRKDTGFSLSGIIRNPDGSVSFEVSSADGREMEGAAIESPSNIKVSKVTDTGAVLRWEPAEGADHYRVSIYDMNSFDGEVFTRFAEGYRFAEAGSECSFTAEGLQPGTRYGATIYACNDVNVARSETPVVILTADGFENSRPVVEATPANSAAYLGWAHLDGAERYELTVATEETVPAEESAECGFDSRKMPEGWSGTGSYETREAWSGASAPSYVLDGGTQYIKTAAYADEITKLSFWARQRFAGDRGDALDIYGSDSEGNLSYIGSTGDFATMKGSDNLREVEIPAGCHSLTLALRMAETGMSLFLDDISLEFASERRLTPVAGSPLSLTENWVRVGDLANGVKHSATVQALKADGTRSLVSAPAQFTPDESLSGVQETLDNSLSNVIALEGRTVVPANPEMSYSVSDLSGATVALGVKGAYTLPAPGLYILTSGRTSAKILVK